MFKNSKIMATIKCFEDLDVWKKVRMLCQDILRITSYETFAKDF
jgi:hypothetical protein